jgi:hypothetical protein
MRVISQDGTLDMPYEICSVWCRGSVIMCDMCGDDTNTILATYSTEEKAKKAMEELRCAYMCHALVKMGQMPPDGIDEKLTIGLGGVFQFPGEEELE